MAKQAGRLRKLLRRVLRFKGLRKLLRGFCVRLLRGAQNVPRSSSEAQLVWPREVPRQSKWDAFESCCGRL